jgi:hypothetical protein
VKNKRGGKGISRGFAILLLSFVLILSEHFVRYFLDVLDIGNPQLFAVWSVFSPEIIAIFALSVLSFVWKGWLYFIMILFFENSIAPRILKFNKIDKFLITFFLFFPFLAIDILTHLHEDGVIYDGIVVYGCNGLLFYLIWNFFLKGLLLNDRSISQQK